jgi:hypothetical protein
MRISLPYGSRQSILLACENFLADMGRRPSPKHSIDRFPNNDGNYEPSNCRWATAKEQNNNQRGNRKITANGKTLGVTEWSKLLGGHHMLVSMRLRAGWSEQDSVTIPCRNKKTR